jgi:hypothetical protein
MKNLIGELQYNWSEQNVRVHMHEIVKLYV